VARGDVAQAVEQGEPLSGELDLLHTLVAGSAPAADEAPGLERVEVVGQRRARDPHRLGHLRLGAPVAEAHEHEHLPRGRRASTGLGHRPLEGLRDHPRGQHDP
jgi:hypothetical protein